jgi:hypothetical protein
MKQKMIEPQEEVDESTISWRLHLLLAEMERSSRQKSERT